MADPQDNAGERTEPVARVGKRHRVVQQGRIVLGPERLVACVVRDLSRSGAKIRVAPEIGLPETFALVIAAHDLRTLTVRLRWRRGDFAGVTFEG
ncbi:PilZ domain-containing protein [Methylobacterium sp. Leaf118]|uniref:PilZ domain-containing protein n=1 Tax=Methylobacterium sp. Leaf118 TaxID=2876562 RepID=UPI001E317468|nr:PilZ domain-containing protein [Methylobacterium sp. Leaf118]